MTARSFLLNTASHGLGGLLATLPMSVAMAAVQRMLPPGQRSRPEPEVITDDMLRRAGVADAIPDPSRKLLAFASHLGFGATAGAAVVALRGGKPLQSMTGGVLAGAMVWAVSYAGWLPRFRILPPPTQRTPGRTVLLLVAHAVWGATLVPAARSARALLPG